MKPKILIMEHIRSEGIELLSKVAEVIFSKSAAKDEVLKEIGEVEGVLLRSSPLDAEMIEVGKNLRVIGRHGVGVDNIDIACATGSGIAVVNTPEANTASVSEHVMALLLCLAKRIIPAQQALREGKFTIPGLSLPSLVLKLGFITTHLEGKTLGLVGIGRIGRMVAIKCSAGLGMKIVAYDPYVSRKEVEKYGIVLLEKLEDLLRMADVVSIHVPLTPETHKLIGERELKLMKPSAFLINTARGEVVDETDLVNALRNNIIAGAALDVFTHEPPLMDDQLFSCPNLLLTPHMGSASEDAARRMSIDVAEGMIVVLKGQKPRYLVNPDYVNYLH